MYYIISHDKKTGIRLDDSEKQEQYMELGIELICNRIYFNYLFDQNIFKNDTDYLVSAKDRMFLYEDYVKNVISYNDFINNHFKENIDIYDFTNSVKQSLQFTRPDGKKYIDDVKNIKYHKKIKIIDSEKILKNKNKFICLVLRQRSVASYRNIPQELIDYIINLSNSNNIDVYIMGKGFEHYNNNQNVHYVSLEECASLINNENCLLFISSISGGGMIRFFTGICNQLVIDLGNEYTPDGVEFGKEIDFSGVIKNNLLSVENDIIKFIDKFENIIRSNL